MMSSVLVEFLSLPLHFPLLMAVVQAQLRAASALRGLAVDEHIRNDIVSRGGLLPLLQLSSSDDVEIQMEVRAAYSANKRKEVPE